MMLGSGRPACCLLRASSLFRHWSFVLRHYLAALTERRYRREMKIARWFLAILCASATSLLAVDELALRLQPALEANSKIRLWFEALSNQDISALHYQGGSAWRSRIAADLGKSAAAFLKNHDDAALAALFADLGGHCMETLVDAFDSRLLARLVDGRRAEAEDYRAQVTAWELDRYLDDA